MNKLLSIIQTKKMKYFGKKNFGSNHNIVFLGLHDCYFMLNYLRNLKIES